MHRLAAVRALAGSVAFPFTAARALSTTASTQSYLPPSRAKGVHLVRGWPAPPLWTRCLWRRRFPPDSAVLCAVPAFLRVGIMQHIREVLPSLAPKPLRQAEAEKMGQIDVSRKGPVVKRPVPQSAREFEINRLIYKAAVRGGAAGVCACVCWRRIARECGVWPVAAQCVRACAPLWYQVSKVRKTFMHEWNGRRRRELAAARCVWVEGVHADVHRE